MPDEIRLEPPPRFEPLPESIPNLVPRLRGLPPYSGPVPDETEPFTSETVSDPLSGRLSDIRERVMQTDRLRRVRGRIADLGASRRGKPDTGERPTLLYVVWDYEAGVSVETTLDEATLEVLDVTESAEQPVISQDEIDRAVELAMADHRLGELLDGSEDLIGMALSIGPVDPQHELFGHRVLDVRMVCPDERLPRGGALVDLTQGSVLRVGDPCGDRHIGEEDR